MEVTRCGIHGFHETIGLDTDEIRFFWVLESSDSRAQQAAYRITVSSDSNNLEGRPDAWDSGRVESDAQRNIICKPEAGFKSTTTYYWQVTVWDQDGQSSRSAVNEFYTSYPRSSRLLPPYSMNQTYMPHTSLIFRTWFENEADRWKAVWIGNGGDKPIYLRKSIQLPSPKRVEKVVIFASGLGHFNLSVNGKPASPHVLDPGWTNYHRTVQFVGYDVTSQWNGRENVIGAHVGNGFYAGDQGDRFFWPMYEDNTYVRYGNELCFFAEIHVHYDDGSHETIISDPSWKVRRSATTLANIYASEDHDRREYPVGWDAPGYDDSTWDPAKPLTGPRGKLRYQSQPPVILHNTFNPVQHKQLRPGVTMFDLGQNSSIMPRVEVSGPAGSEIIIRYSETVDDEGAVFMPDPLFKEFEYGVYTKFILSGTGEREIWTPDFSFTSARYIQIEGASLDETNNLPIIHSVSARHVSSAARQLGYVKTDKQDVNDLINACYWSFSSNIFSYHTDCPQIEKFGWLEVTSLLAPATQYVRDMEAVYSKILDDIIDTQEPTGLVPTMAPEIRYMCGPLHDTITWGCAIAFLPELLKQYYGSTEVFSKIYQPCVRYMEYMKTKERHGGLIEHGLGDWGRDIAFGNHQANIETAVYHRCLRNVALMATELGHRDDEARFTAWADRIHTVYNTHLLISDKATRPYAFYTSLDNPGTHDCTMVSQAVALQFGLVPTAYRGDVIQAFLAACAASGNRMQAGEIGLKYVWNTLADPAVNRPDIVLEMARQEEHPSYMRFLRRGETTLLEFWQDACRSKCHDMLGTIYEWVYEAVLGVRAVGDAYRTWTLRPPVGSEFGLVQGEVECPYGLIKVRFESVGGDGRLDVRVPMSTSCTLVLPACAGVVSGLPGELRTTSNGNGVGEEVVLPPGTYQLVLSL
ncbi:Alpha-rhamnosidase [Aspergillus mulundensis]|uniref:alpha-L-rhamnosidase n=1 Tax=Aspergillus mulundensis TaxID=1810919 RepID=A0A3D8R4H3_9EURO|nr:Alpha-rhamnosidase [Aspergillus mulundensis]RDW68876.1 Alpha-rhamnosidase [Aspergillus mulundensis]